MVRAFLNIYNSVFEMNNLRPVGNKAVSLINSNLRYIYDQNRVRISRENVNHLFKWGITTCIRDTIGNGDFSECSALLMHHS